MIRFVFMIHFKAGMTGGRLRKTMKDRFSEIEQEHYDTIEAFSKRLSNVIGNRKYEIYIVFADTQERIKELMAMKNLLEGRRLLLVVTGNNKKTLSMAHRLHPRFISCDIDRFQELGDVLEKIAGTLESDKRKENVSLAIQ